MKRTFTLEKESGARIPCIEEIPAGCKRIVIVVHGFSSSKESSNAANLFRELVPRGFGVIAYDQPGHGSAEASAEPLRIRNCLDSLARVEQYLLAEHPGAEVCYFGSSFGAYITGLYLATRKPAGHKAFLRCAAVNFPDLLMENPAYQPGSPEYDSLQRTGSCELALGGDDIIRIDVEFLDELKANDLFAAFDALAATGTLCAAAAPADGDALAGAGSSSAAGLQLRMAHGEADSVVPVEHARRFAERFHIPLTTFPGEEHTISENPASPIAVATLAAELFGEK